MSYKLCEDVNEIVFCRNIECDAKTWNDGMEKAAKHINDLLKKEPNHSEIIDVEEFIEKLQIWNVELCENNAIFKWTFLFIDKKIMLLKYRF